MPGARKDKPQAQTTAPAPARPRREGPRSVNRALEVLRLVASSPSELSLTEIAKALALPKSSALNVMRSLAAENYVAVDGGKYVLGSSALSLAGAIGATISFPASIMPKLRALAEDTTETVTLGRYSEDGRMVIYMEVIESIHPLRLSRRRGANEPIHAGSLGQALMAFMPDAQLRNLLAQRKLPALTEHTLTKAQIAERIAEIRKSGVALNVAGQTDGVMGAGAPVFDATGALCGAIAAGGPIGRIKPRQKQIMGQVRTTAEEMSRVLGYQGVYPPPRGEVEAGAAAPAKRRVARS